MTSSFDYSHIGNVSVIHSRDVNCCYPYIHDIHVIINAKCQECALLCLNTLF